jgi:hypothetical protein
MSAVTETPETPREPQLPGQFAQAALLSDAYQVLQFNQQLVQFADSKAGNLIVINSLFIAAAQASNLGAGATGLPRYLALAYVICSSLAVLFCLSTIMSRVEPPPSPRKDMIFFGDILTRKQPARYAQDFQATPLPTHLDDVLRRTYVLASIAARKFESYGTAQNLTAYSAVAWVAANALALLH